MGLNREQIIKALECYAKDDCDNCPNSFGNCYANLAGYALALIKELNEEIESRKQTIDQLGKNNDEIARVYPLAIKEAKADTVRKMQESLKANSEIVYGDRAVCVELIDQIAKEMINNGEKEN